MSIARILDYIKHAPESAYILAMAASDDTCADGNCEMHFHAQESIEADVRNRQQTQHSQAQLLQQPGIASEEAISDQNRNHGKAVTGKVNRRSVGLACDPNDRGFRRIVRNFTPS